MSNAYHIFGKTQCGCSLGILNYRHFLGKIWHDTIGPELAHHHTRNARFVGPSVVRLAIFPQRGTAGLFWRYSLE